MSTLNLRKTILFISIGLFVISLSQKCFCTTYSCGDSIAVFFSGFFGFFLSFTNLIWLANPLLILSWIIINRNNKLSVVMSFLAALFALSFLFFPKIIDNENGNVSQIISYKIGYWLWLASCWVMFLGNFFIYRYSKATPLQVRESGQALSDKGS